MALKLITAPVAEPITLAEAKAHLRVDVIDDDAYITALIVAARQAAEHATGRALMPQTWELALDAFDDVILLPRPPLASVTSVTYIDADGVTQTLASYLLDDHSQPARLLPAYGADWPTTREQANAVLIRYSAGYADAASVPQPIKSWMLLHIGMLYENREAVVESSMSRSTFAAMPQYDRLIDPYRVWSA